MDGFKRVRMALDKLKRLGGPPKRKHPANPPMLRACLRLAEKWTPLNRIILRALLCTGFSFMLRSSEFLSRGGAGWDLGKVLRPRDIELRCDGRRLEEGEYQLANEVSIFLRQSKSDQYNEGCVLTHHAASNNNIDLCVVRALRDLAMAAPQRWREERDLPLSRWEDGTPVTRTQIRGLLAQAGVE